MPPGQRAPQRKPPQPTQQDYDYDEGSRPGPTVGTARKNSPQGAFLGRRESAVGRHIVRGAGLYECAVALAEMVGIDLADG